jgi:hypothetical protein
MKLKRQQQEEEKFGWEEWRMKTNQIGLAPLEVRQRHEEEMRKKYGGGSSLASGRKLLDDGKLFKYIPLRGVNKQYRSDKYKLSDDNNPRDAHDDNRQPPRRAGGPLTLRRRGRGRR